MLQDLLLNDPGHAGAAARVEGSRAVVASSVVKRRPLTSPRRGDRMPPPPPPPSPPWRSRAPAPAPGALPRSHPPARRRGRQPRTTGRSRAPSPARSGRGARDERAARDERRGRRVLRGGASARTRGGGCGGRASSGLFPTALRSASLPREIRKAFPSEVCEVPAVVLKHRGKAASMSFFTGVH